MILPVNLLAQLDSDNEFDELQSKLQATLHAIHRERAKQIGSNDRQIEIQELLRQKGELTEIIRRKKARKMGLDPDIEYNDVFSRIRRSFASSGVTISNRLTRINV